MQVPGKLPPAASDLALFLKGLAEEGRAIVSPQPLPAESPEAVAVLRQIHDHARNELGVETPAFSETTALWAACLFYQLAQFTACRDIGEEQIAQACRVQPPEPRTPATDWSADLTLRHLPKLFAVARHFSNADPLVQQMKNIAAAWPLSSVGIPGLGTFSIDSFISDPALARLYADRIIAEGDFTRLGDPRVDDLLRADFGFHRDLAPRLAEKLFPATP